MDIREFQDHLWRLFRSISLGLDGTIRPVVESFGLTMTQLRILVELKEHKELTVGELGQAIGTAPGNTSSLCKTMEQKGLVSRERSSQDERIVLISMTAPGRELLQQVEAELSAKCDPILQAYSPADYQQIITGMEKLREVVTSLNQAVDKKLARR